MLEGDWIDCLGLRGRDARVPIVGCAGAEQQHFPPLEHEHGLVWGSWAMKTKGVISQISF